MKPACFHCMAQRFAIGLFLVLFALATLVNTIGDITRWF